MSRTNSDATVPPRLDTLVIGVTLFHLGSLYNDQSTMTFRRGMGTRVEIPVTGAFIEMADGEHILFDTGMLPPGWEGHAPPPRVLSMIANYGPQDDIRARLGEIGRTTDDVKMVINSHFHWDHSGANRLFDKARVFIQLSEYRFACLPDTFIEGPYIGNFLEKDRPFELLEGDRVIKPGIAVLTTPGHTPGHQSLLVRLPSGRTMIFTGDALSCPANLHPQTPPGNAHCLEHAVASINRLKMLADFLDGDLVICHDPAFWETWRPAPHCYV
ncbi:N-acyl homoserine lactonase family protein [Siculibacillus lacustris]|nr:N-acyl homoserine lactonase family protein [Siculibacillus lacustris]